MPPSGHRASDAEREAVADRLRAAAGDGRLDPDELEERLSAAYGARTTDELVPLTADLPAELAPAAAGPLEAQRPPGVLRRQLGAFLTANVVAWSVWLVTGAPDSVWPKWVLLGTGLALATTVIRLLTGGDDQRRR